MKVPASRMMTALVSLSVGACVAAHGIALDANHYLSGDVAGYDRAMSAGLEAMRAGDYSRAAGRFREALATPRHEVPNYEAFVPLAMAQCRLGDKAEGRQLLDDVDCMLDVDEGTLGCPVSSPPDGFVRRGGTRRCFETMCGEMFLSYYRSPTQEQLARIRGLRADLEAGKAECR